MNEWCVKYTHAKTSTRGKAPHGDGPFYSTTEHAIEKARLLQRKNPHLVAHLFFRHHELPPAGSEYEAAHRFADDTSVDDYDFWRELPREKWTLTAVAS